MENNNAIGLLNSGLGGLSVYREIKKQLPQEQIIYFGDTAHAPYGEKAENQIREYTFSIINFLIQHHVKIVIIACNTATALVISKIEMKYAIPIIGVIQPGAEEAIRKTKNKRVGIIGTEITIRNQSYEKMIQKKDPSILTFSHACSNQIIRLMEKGFISNRIGILLQDCLRPIIENDVDTLFWDVHIIPF